jgi:hypothetical protein
MQSENGILLLFYIFLSHGNGKKKRSGVGCKKGGCCVLSTSTCVRYSTIETKEAARIGYNGFLFPHSYSCGKRNPLYPIRATSFVSIIMYLTCTIIVLLKKNPNGMTFNPTTTLKLIY